MKQIVHMELIEIVSKAIAKKKIAISNALITTRIKMLNSFTELWNVYNTKRKPNSLFLPILETIKSTKQTKLIWPRLD